MEFYEPLITGLRCEVCGEKLGIIQYITISNELGGDEEKHCVCSHCHHQILLDADKVLRSDAFITYALGIAYRLNQ